MSTSHQPDCQRTSMNAPRSRYQQVAPSASSHTGERPHRDDPFYGHRTVATLGARFINHLFDCPDPAATPNSPKQSPLAIFIAYGLYRTKLPPCVTFASLILLQRLKARFPTARGSSGHRLWISAFMIASKVICDDTYSNKSWGIVAQGMFNLREINQMEREMCNYLEWELNVDDSMLTNFEKQLREDYASQTGPYPTYPLSMVSKRVPKAPLTPGSTATTPSPAHEASETTSPIPSFGNHRQQTPPATTQSAASTWTARSSPQTPSPSYSTSTSPASSASPATPVGGEDYSARVQGLDSTPMFTLQTSMPPVHPLKSQMSALAMPSRW